MEAETRRRARSKAGEVEKGRTGGKGVDQRCAGG